MRGRVGWEADFQPLDCTHMGARAFVRTTSFVSAGLLIWAVDFLFIYVFAALACARGYADVTFLGVGIVPFTSTAATVIAAGATITVMRAGASKSSDRAVPENGDTPTFLARLALIVAMIALIAVAFTGLPGLLVSRLC
jgi:hypothetical protein